MGTNYYVKNSLNPETDCLHIGKSSGDQDSWMGILVRRGEELGVIVRSEITWHTVVSHFEIPFPRRPLASP